MAYTTIDKPTDYFNTKLYTGNGSTQSISSVGFQPDWVWIKERDTVHEYHNLYDAIRGATKTIYSNDNSAEATQTGLTSFNSDGFSVGSYDIANKNTSGYASWNWLAGGTAPAITYSVKVVSDSGNKYRFDDFGTSAVTLDLQEGGTYTFDQSDSSNSGHPLRFSTTSNGTHGGGSEYTTGVTTTGTPGNSGAKTVITVAASAPTLYYYCTQHSGMGGQANTNSTFGSSNFSGSIQSTVSANTTAGFSIVSYTGTGSNATVSHGLGVTPKIIFWKRRDNTAGAVNWIVQSTLFGNQTKLVLNTTEAFSTNATFSQTNNWDSSTIDLKTYEGQNHSSATYIAYCFAEKKGYSKFGSYTGNGSTDGTFVYTGFKPAWLMIKRTDTTNDWIMYDNKRNEFNVVNTQLYADLNSAEGTAGSGVGTDILSNGFKQRGTGGSYNASGGSYIYMAFAENPFVTSTGIPTTAR
tara:strand:- start:542 stop:1936 length:1395 start_codon:yes stop_codon:yes gene_type:complete